jgi:hypothetical protein
METGGNSSEQPQLSEEDLESLRELMARMRTPEARMAANSLFTATSAEISKATAGSRFRRLDHAPDQDSE